MQEIKGNKPPFKREKFEVRYAISTVSKTCRSKISRDNNLMCTVKMTNPFKVTGESRYLQDTIIHLIDVIHRKYTRIYDIQSFPPLRIRRINSPSGIFQSTHTRLSRSKHPPRQNTDGKQFCHKINIIHLTPTINKNLSL